MRPVLDWRLPDDCGPRVPGRRIVARVVWSAFLVFPIVNAATQSTAGARFWLVLAGAVVFVALYAWLIVVWARPSGRAPAGAVAVALLAVAIALTVHDPAWGYLFSYVAAGSALVTPSPYGMPVVLGATAIGVAAALIGGSDGGAAAGFGASTIGVGLLLTLLRDLTVRNDELAEARAELARAAVTAERERFARDLHDLLGHSLSVIAIKAELAGRLLPAAPARAATEVSDLEAVARTALGEVREAVSGYRRPTLDGELEGARVALAAAGIAAEFERCEATLPSEVEAVLAWAVREGATNVIRHSGARRCEVRVRYGAEGAGVEVLDDGAGCGGARSEATAAEAGNGLSGLRERAAAVRGRLEAGTASGGGFRLAVSVPAQAHQA